jgi:hypothetical protein
MKYTCPKCKKKQTSAVRWENVDVAYEFFTEGKKKGEYQKIDEVFNECVGWSCPECDAELPNSIVKSLEKII